MSRIRFVFLALTASSLFAGGCSDGTSNWIIDLPKVQTHVHLDGSVRLTTIWDIAQRDGINLGVKSIDELKAKCRVTKPMKSLQDVLDVFWVHQKVLNSYENIRRVTFENIEDAYLDGVILLELRFAPTFIAVGKPNLTNGDIIKGVLDGVQDGMQEYAIEVGLIAIGVRGLDHEANRQALVDVLKFRKSDHPLSERLVGYDLAAAESGTKPEDFLDLITMARAGGLHITIHSGEETNAQYVKNTIEILGAERIGHGIKSWGNEDVMNLLKTRHIHLEISVTSNWLTGSVSTLEEHPIRKFYDNDISISINTDDPHLMGINLIHEYELVADKFGFTREDFMRINRDALEHSFLPETIKSRVRSQYFN